MRDYAVAAVGRTHVGLQKPNNEDSFHIGRGLLLVADGVGGSVAGEVASRTVVEVFAGVETASPDDDLYAILTDAVQRSTNSLLEQVEADPELEGMGTTATVMMWSGRRIVFAQIGDSRAYYLQGGAPGGTLHSDQQPELQQVTKDDSFVQHLVDQGLLAPDEAAHHPRRNVILKALNGSTVSPSFSTFAPRIGDRYLLCSDGLSDYVEADEIREALLGTDAEPAADRLIELSLAAGAPDNVTVIIADIGAGH
ncbi:PP2C family protein-serine/threonine phosphatase [Nakamurella lactea]|uniref:PP2C family protein-serine/threonine phosphatase n=1 Tax=Nakamurella lactea TaxID=459515 RepID=UPI00041811F1|nr:protein phosphatase 2C domain-containing protein [Nakamurella lactea]